MPDSWYFYCPICEDWRPQTEHVSVKNGFRVKKKDEQPHVSYSICKKCLAKVNKAKQTRK